MEQDELRRLEDQCIQEQPPGCAAACPIHVDVRAMMGEAAQGQFSEAAKILKKTIPFPGIISRVCDQPCRSACKRMEVGDPLSVAAIEKSCLDYAADLPQKIAILPKKGKRVAVVGGGLSGLTAAFDLARKGYSLVVFEAGSFLGGSLRYVPEDSLPTEVLESDFQILERAGVEIRLNTTVGKEVPFDSLCTDFDAVYVGVGSEASDLLGLAVTGGGLIAVDPLTLATERERVFAGGSLRRASSVRSPIQSISDGRIAAVSIDRLLQQVSLTASRIGEGSTSTRLFTSTEGVEPLPAVPVALREGYSQEEAAREAARCLQCQCLECVKVCEYLNSFKSYPRKYVRQVYNNLSIVMGHRHANKLINSCSICGLCREVCPEDLHMGLVCKQAREALVAMGKMPPSAHDFPLRDMEFSNGDKCAFARHQPGAVQSTYLFFPGCQLAASAPEQVKEVYRLLTHKLEGGVGFMSRCCGAPADWSGRTDLFQATLEEFREEWRQMGSPQLILACSTCYEIFKSHLPDASIVSLWEVLDRLGLPEDMAPATQPTSLAIHDACTTRHEASIQQSVRSILRRLGYGIEELRLSRDKTECCGYGGLMFFANRELARSVIRRRVGESPLDYLTYCAMCRDYLASSGKRTVHLLDLLFGPSREEAALRKGPVYSQRHENRARLKRAMLKAFWGESMSKPGGYETIHLEISEEVQQRMEDRQILVEDLQQVIDYAERTGYKLHNRETGHFLAHHKPTRVTYWVEYSPSDDGFIVHNAYSHRMEIEEVLKP